MTKKIPAPEVGQRIGRLVVVNPEVRDSGGRRAALCVCECDKMTTVRLDHLRDSSTRSCGCLAAELTRERMTELPTPKVGQRFGRGEVIDPAIRIVTPSSPGGFRGARLVCDDNNVYEVPLADLYREKGAVKSCGCLRDELTRERNRLPENIARFAAIRQDPGNIARSIAARTTHGLHGHELYHTWYSMLSRCENERDKDYPRWGGRGVKVYDPWHDVAVLHRRY